MKNIYNPSHLAKGFFWTLGRSSSEIMNRIYWEVAPTISIALKEGLQFEIWRIIDEELRDK